eukprot:s1502_g10.t1
MTAPRAQAKSKNLNPSKLSAPHAVNLHNCLRPLRKRNLLNCLHPVGRQDWYQAESWKVTAPRARAKSKILNPSKLSAPHALNLHNCLRPLRKKSLEELHPRSPGKLSAPLAQS